MRLDLDLDIRRGAFVLSVRETFRVEGVTALFGPNGAGKTTLLQALAGFLPGTGRIQADGTIWQDDRTTLPPHRRPVGLVFQEGRLFPHLDVAGNLDFAAQRADPAGPAIEQAGVIEALGLGSLLRRRTDSLSGGEARRVAIGRSLLARPSLLLMDEPLAALDRERKAAILGMIAGLPERFGLPVVFVSHLVEEIAQIADRLIAVSDGRVIGQGPAVAMLERLDSEVTGHFEAGSIIEGAVQSHDTEHALTAVAAGGDLVWTPGASHVRVGERVRLRLRSRDVAVSLRRIEGVSIRNQLRARVAEILEEPGAHAELRLDCAGQMIRSRITRLSLQELGLRSGMEVFALIKTVAFDRRLESP